ncbi:glucose-6-phosphate isomerase [Mycoplasmopsis bovis]|uniref:glucose-6-phosphate isomerase n=1 Tax=Mycoplasmopsis bovis TaxID=28903 RepID=UPI003D81B12A
MKYINVDISNALELNEINKYYEQVVQIHHNIINQKVNEKGWLGWINLPNNINNLEMKKMIDIANVWKKQKVSTLVVIGIGGSYLGARAAYDYVFDTYKMIDSDIELIFAGNSLSSEQLVAQLKYVENKKFAINVISKSGTTIEPSIAFREFRKLLEFQVGSQYAKDYIVATTDAQKGVLYELSKAKNYETLIIPNDVGGRFSVLSPVGLFPLICAGINVEILLKGAADANSDCNNLNLNENQAYKYAVARHILSKKYDIELMSSYEPKLSFFIEWWKQLFAESEGKDNKGLWVVGSTFTTDLHSIGQIIQDGKRILFETILVSKEPLYDILLSKVKEDDDKLNYLDGKSVHKINLSAFKGTLSAHSKAALVPNIVIEIAKLDEYALGYLFQFFMRALTISAYLLGVNPFDQPGVEIYKSNMFKILNKDDK